jgi:hypothetical protein
MVGIVIAGPAHARCRRLGGAPELLRFDKTLRAPASPGIIKIDLL